MKIFKRLIQKAAIAIAIGTAGVTATAVPLMPTENVLAATTDNMLDAYEAKAREFEEWAEVNNYEIELVDLEYWSEDTMEGIQENINNCILFYDMQMEETTEGPVYLFQLQLKYSPNENEGYKRTITFEDTNGNKIGEDVVQTEQKIPCWYIIDGLDLRRQIDGEDITKTEGWEEYTPSVNDLYADLQKDYVLLSPASIPEKLPTEDETVTVKFEKNTQTRTITFNANGGTGTMSKQNIKPGVAAALTANAFTKAGYVFNGWNTKADGTGTSYANKQSVTLNANTTLYAQWKPNTTRTVSFKANGGTGKMSDQKIRSGVAATFNANTFTRTGYVFNGWNSRADGKGTAYKDKQKVTFNASMTLYAQWKPHANGWVKENGGYKYYKDGKPYTGWHKMGKVEGEKKPHWSYFDDNGVFYTGWHKMGKAEGEKTEHWSYFGNNGWLRTGWQKLDKNDGEKTPHWSYFGSNGWLKTGLQKMGTSDNPDGKAAKHYSYFGNNGWLVTNKNFTYKGKNYTADSKGWAVKR